MENKHIFRAKDKNGNLIYWNEFGFIIRDINAKEFEYIGSIQIKIQNNEIDLNTVSEYTNLDDSRRKKIFNGDIVECIDKINDFSFKAIVLFGNVNCQDNWGYQLRVISNNYKNPQILHWVECDDVGVFINIIGSIYDNKKLEYSYNNYLNFNDFFREYKVSETDKGEK